MVKTDLNICGHANAILSWFPITSQIIENEVFKISQPAKMSLKNRYLCDLFWGTDPLGAPEFTLSKSHHKLGLSITIVLK